MHTWIYKQEADNSARWLTDNKLCVAGDKSKLLVIGTRQIRMSQVMLKLFASGLFYSTLSYCLPVFGNVVGLEKYKEVNNKY